MASVVVVLGAVASVVVVGGTAGQNSGEGASVTACCLSSHTGAKLGIQLCTKRISNVITSIYSQHLPIQ